MVGILEKIRKKTKTHHIYLIRRATVYLSEQTEKSRGVQKKAMPANMLTRAFFAYVQTCAFIKRDIC